jgi:Protein of unknown function (DUF1566)
VGVVGSLFASGCGRHGAEPLAAAPDDAGPRPTATRCHAAWTMPNPPAPGLPNPQSYDTSHADVVLDRVTGLSWQRAVESDSYDLTHATDHCRVLTLGGYHDWRLPALIELASIVDVSKANPAADPTAFPGTPPVPFWSAQKDVTNGGLGWYVFFKTGGIYVGNDTIDPARVRCVRGPPSCSDAGVSPYSSAGVLVHDAGTGLTWQRLVEPDNYTFQEANEHCAKLSVSGGGWRLPSVRELLTLVDLSRVEPAIDASTFPMTPSEFFWSSSPSLAPAGTGWGVNFTRGSSGAALLGTTAHVRCARSGNAAL